MLGTIVNTIAIAAGGALGLIIKNNLKDRYKEIINQGIGLAVMLIGLSSSLGKLMLPDAHPMLFIISLVVGGLVGEKINIEARLASLGEFLQNKLSSSESNFASGFVTASLIFCVGTMAILGSLESGIRGQHDILFAKSVLDGVSSIIFASTMGLGVLFSGISVFVYQGAITMLAKGIAPYLTTPMTNEISIVGGILILGIGLKMLGIKNFKVGNMLPAVLVPVVYYLVVGLI